jgi:hypothetical protein
MYICIYIYTYIYISRFIPGIQGRLNITMTMSTNKWEKMEDHLNRFKGKKHDTYLSKLRLKENFLSPIKRSVKKLN